MAAPADIRPLAKKQRTYDQEICMEEEHGNQHAVISPRHICSEWDQYDKDEDGNIEPENVWINDLHIMKLTVVFDPEEGKYEKCYYKKDKLREEFF
jgi:hypothetical protein